MKRKILYLKCVAYSDLNDQMGNYLNLYKDENTEISVRNIEHGTSHLEYRFYQAVNQMEIMKNILQAEKDGFDGCVISCFDDPCLYEAREMCRNMVVTAPGEASMHLAATLGYNFSIVVGRKKWIPQMYDNVIKYGFEKKLKSFRCLDLGVLDFHKDEQKTTEKLKETVRQAIELDQAEVIILGCTMQFGFFEELQNEFDIPIIDPMIAAVKYAEYLIDIKEKAGWTFSRKGLYERPSDEEMSSWNLEEMHGLNGLL